MQKLQDRSQLWLRLHRLILYARGGAQEHRPWGWGGETSQLDLPSLTPLYVAGCGRLQLGVPHWATSVDYCKQLIIDPTFCGSRFSAGRLPAKENFTFFTSSCTFLFTTFPLTWTSLPSESMQSFSDDKNNHVIWKWWHRFTCKGSSCNRTRSKQEKARVHVVNKKMQEYTQ